jgi:hypothetical protein
MRCCCGIAARAEQWAEIDRLLRLSWRSLWDVVNASE